MKKLIQDGLKKFNHTSAVMEDEIYFFRRPINPAKVNFFYSVTITEQLKTFIPQFHRLSNFSLEKPA